MGRVQILHDENLETGGATLARSDDRPSQEELPNLRNVRSQWTSESDKLTLNHRWPYLALIVSALPIQFRYHLQRVPE
jgi:hypothetical protein